ncbi:MAG: response regulator [Chromatiales bacterium]|nr:response regulator [Chromatiales bacterium]
MTTETVFIVDDDESIRDSLTWLLEAVDLNVRTYESAEAFLEQNPHDVIGCLILDVRMSGMSGLELLNKLVDQQCTLPIIILTGHGDVPMAVRAMSDGAFYFVQKPVNGPELVAKVREALAISHKLLPRKQESDALKERYNTLTKREREVMAMIISGAQNKVIAADLGIVERTVEVHRHRVMEKMQAHSVADLVQMNQRLTPQE